MPSTLPAPADARPLLSSEKRGPMAQVPISALRKAEDDETARALIGKAIERAAKSMGWNLDEFAREVDRDPRQVARWFSGKENPQFHALFAVPAFRGPLVIALAALADDIDVTTTISIRRRSA